MPAPATNDELLDFVLKSGVVEEPRLKTYTARLKAEPGAMPDSPEELAGVLIRDGLLTGFQAEQLLQGKWKRFSLGKYKVLEKLGTGGMGTVFLCEHKLMKRRVAVKVLPVAKAQDEASLQRFYREARAVAAVDHPNLVRAYDIDEDDGLHFLVMEYVDGINLHDLVKRHGKLDLLRACHYMYGSAIGLHHAHEMGLVHRDIKPANILVDRSGVVKILDMGLARFFNPDEDDLLTKKFDESVLGTADYLAPEQAIDSSMVDIRADIYGLGGTFYYLLTGSPPFPDGTVAQKLLWHQTKDPKPVREYRPEMPPELDAIVLKMMAKEANDRYQTPEELIHALAPWVQTAIGPPPENEMPQLSLASQGGLTQHQRNAGNSSSNMGSSPFMQPTVVPGSSNTSGTGSDAIRAKALADMATTPGPRAAGPQPFVPKAIGSGPRPAVPIQPMPMSADSPELLILDDTPNLQDTAPNPFTDTTRSSEEDSSEELPKRRASAKAKRKKSGMPMLIIGGLLLFLFIGGSAAAALFYFKPWQSKTEPTQNAGPQESKKWLVSASGSGGANVKKSLAEAVAAAGPGDVISIADARLETGPIRLAGEKKANIRIESGIAGKPVTLVYKAEGNTRQVSLMELASAEGFTLSGVVLELDSKIDFGIGIVGKSGGMKIEDVTIRNPKMAGIRIQNAAGEADRPLILNRVRIGGTKAFDSGIWFFSSLKTMANMNIHIQRIRLEGPTKYGVRVDGLIQEVEITQSRIHNCETGIHVNHSFSGDQDYGLKLERNTFHEIKGTAVDFSTGPAGLKQPTTMTKNYFAKTGKIANAGTPGTMILATDNARDAVSKEGNIPTNAKVIPNINLLNLNPDHAEFLKVPPGSALAGYGAE